MSEITLSPLIVPASATPGFLVVESGSLSGQQFMLPIAPGALLLGRERTCSVRFDPEKDRVVGRTHARLEVRPDGVYLVDLNSANGTFRMDGTALRGEMRLHHGERFQLGGENGPWLSLQLPVSRPTAIHFAPPQADAMTVITRLAPPPPVAAQLPASAPAAAPAFTPAPAFLPAPVPGPGQLVTPVPPFRPAPAIAPVAAPSERAQPAAPPAAVPAELKHRRQYRQQIALICLLLVIASAVGLGLGLRDTQGDEDETPTGSVP